MLFQRLGIADDSDIDRLKKRFGIKTKEDEENIDEVLESATNLGRKKSRYKLKNEKIVKESFKQLL